uniref:Bifunctional glutamate/proline--tRNA ligase n=1 Tax=Lygus hesperus TaxID=30085 RepID=A0A0A9VYT0_LYGHE
MIRHGLQVQALRDFMILQGPSRNITLMEWDKLWSLNHTLLETQAPRYNALQETDIVAIELVDIESNTVVQIPLHPKDTTKGVKDVVRSKIIYVDQQDACNFVQGEEVTLISWGNIRIDKIVRSDDGAKVTHIMATTHIDGDFKTTKWKVQWIGCNSLQELQHGVCIEYGPIITVKQPGDQQTLEEIVNRTSILKAPV